MRLQNSNKKKICIVVSSLGKGGAERSSALLSTLLTKLGYEVHIISVLNHIHYQYAGELLNLGAMKDKDDSVFGRLKRFLLFRRYVKRENFDVIIDNRTRHPVLREVFISLFIYKLSVTIFMVRSFNLAKYFPANKFVAMCLYKKAFKVVGVSKEISSEIKKKYNLKNVEDIYNPLPILEIDNQQINFNYILAYGRLYDVVKNFSLLIDAYKVSKLKEQNIKLLILGNGVDKDMLQLKVSELGLQNDVLFYPYQPNPYAYIKQAKFICLTSRYEGFPRVLIEALSLGTPVISVNCKSGPKEIIKHQYNGLLVDNFNKDALAEAMNSFIFDKNLYNNCKVNAKKSVSHLSIENISIAWEQLLNSI